MSYYDTSYPPSLWTNPDPGPTPATGATVGAPGTWTPLGSAIPASVATIGSVVASPATAWANGAYMQTLTAGAAGQAYWNGTAWTAGTAPADPPEEPETETEPVDETEGA